MDSIRWGVLSTCGAIASLTPAVGWWRPQVVDGETDNNNSLGDRDHNTIMIVMYALEALCNMAKAMAGTNNLWIRINREGYI